MLYCDQTRCVPRNYERTRAPLRFRNWPWQQETWQHKAQSSDCRVSWTECALQVYLLTFDRAACPFLLPSFVSPNSKACFDISVTHTSIEDCRSEEHTSELQSLMRHSYAVF